MRFFGLILWVGTIGFSQTADLTVINARIYTGNAKQPLARTLTVRNGLILCVGDEPATARSVIDARGATVLPGLIDSHGHVEALGGVLENLDLRGVSSEREIADLVQVKAKQHKPGEWILGRGWDQNLWSIKNFPTAASISIAAAENPVVLTRVDGHAIWVNRRAMDLADLNAATPEVAGGRIVRDQAGSPTGILLDNAQSLVTRKIPPPSRDEVERRILRGLEECARFGITSVHDAWVEGAGLEAYQSLTRANRMPIRAYLMIGGPGTLTDQWLDKGTLIGNYLTIRSVKLVADGALGSRGAALLQPYSDDSKNSGILILDRAAIRSVAEQALAHGFQVNTHAIGDAANRATLDAYGDVLKGPNDKRFRIEHAQIVAPEDFEKFRRFSIIASMQPTHATSDMPWAGARLGPERLKGAYAWRTFLALGIHVPGGSDFPVEKVNPILGFYAAITRRDVDGNPPGGWMPSQRMTREEAFRSWTIEGAYAAFEEFRKGSLEPGKMADFVMLSGDIMRMPVADIPSVHVTMTVVGGKVVYRL